MHLPLFTDLLPNTLEKADLFLYRVPENPRTHEAHNTVLLCIPEAQCVRKPSVHRISCNSRKEMSVQTGTTKKTQKLAHGKMCDIGNSLLRNLIP